MHPTRNSIEVDQIEGLTESPGASPGSAIGRRDGRQWQNQGSDRRRLESGDRFQLELSLAGGQDGWRSGDHESKYRDARLYPGASGRNRVVRSAGLECGTAPFHFSIGHGPTPCTRPVGVRSRVAVLISPPLVGVRKLASQKTLREVPSDWSSAKRSADGPRSLRLSSPRRPVADGTGLGSIGSPSPTPCMPMVQIRNVLGWEVVRHSACPHAGPAVPHVARRQAEGSALLQTPRNPRASASSRPP